MNAKDLIVGLTYMVPIRGRYDEPVELLRIDRYETRGRTLTRYICRNLLTKREITVKSARRFKCRAIQKRGPCPHD